MQPSFQQHPRCRVMSCGAVPWRGPESAAYRVGLSKGRPYGIRHHRVGARAASGLGPAARIGAPHHAHASARGFTRRQRAPQRPTALDRAPLRHGSPPDTSSSPLDTSSRLVLALLDYRRARQRSPTFLATPASLPTLTKRAFCSRYCSTGDRPHPVVLTSGPPPPPRADKRRDRHRAAPAAPAGNRTRRR